MRRPTNRICLRRRSSVLHAALPSRPIGTLHLGLAGNRRVFLFCFFLSLFFSFFFSLFFFFFFFRGQIPVTQTHHGDSHINYVEELKLKLVKEPGEKAHFNIARPYKCRPTASRANSAIYPTESNCCTTRPKNIQCHNNDTIYRAYTLSIHRSNR